MRGNCRADKPVGLRSRHLASASDPFPCLNRTETADLLPSENQGEISSVAVARAVSEVVAPSAGNFAGAGRDSDASPLRTGQPGGRPYSAALLPRTRRGTVAPRTFQNRIPGSWFTFTFCVRQHVRSKDLFRPGQSKSVHALQTNGPTFNLFSRD